MARMDVCDRPIYPRLAVLLVLILAHGGLILVFQREKPAHTARSASLEVPMILFFIDPSPPPPPETERIPHRPISNLTHPSQPKTVISPPEPISPAENAPSTAPAAVDWLMEAQRSAAEITSRQNSGRAAEAPDAPHAPAPWDSRPLLESTGHGMKIRIPVDIPGDIIDHCFGNTDVAHDQTGQTERLQLGCAFGKRPVRGDLFDSLRKPAEAPK
jgi:hypothetical protein